MKRLRDDANDNRSFGSSHEKSQLSQVCESDLCERGGSSADGADANKPKPTIDDAFSYMKQVKDMFPDQSEKYNNFCHIMINFKNQRIDTLGVIARVKELFKGHPSLVLGFNPFLPKGYEILILNDVDKKKTDYFEQASSIVKKLKERLGNGHEYRSIIDIVSMYNKKRKDIKEVAVLLNDHPDLLDEFTRFLPDDSVIANLLSNLDKDKKFMK